MLGVASLLAGVPAVVAAPASSGPDWYAFRSFGTVDGLPHNSVLTLAQDAEGWIHAGTAQGLARDEGGRWRLVPLPGDPEDPAVGALLLTQAGEFWVGTDSAGLFRRRGEDYAAVPLPTPQSVTALAEAADGAVWVGTLSGLLRCTSRCTDHRALAPQGVRSLLFETVAGADRERLWIGGNGDGLRELALSADPAEARVLRQLTREDGLPNGVILALRRHGNALWIGSGRGLARYDGQRLTRYGPAQGVPEAMVFALQPWTAPDGVEQLMVTLRPGGLLAIDTDGRWRGLDARHGLPGNAPQALLVERQRGGLWIGSWDAGVARIEPNRWALFDEGEGLPSRLVHSVGWSAATGTLWAGTAAGPAIWQHDRFVPLPAAAPLQLNALLDTADGSRWLAHSRGLERWQHGQRVESFSVDAGVLPGLAVHQLASLPEPDGLAVYAGTSHGLARWTAPGGLTRVRGIDGIPDDAAAGSFRVQTERGQPVALWILRSGRLLQRSAAGWQRIEPACLAGEPIQALEVEAVEHGGRRWLGTRRGLYELSESQCRAWPAAAGLGGLVHLRRTPQGLYVFGARSALRLDPDGDPTQAGEPQTTADGLPRPDVSATALDDRGRLYAATTAGLAAFEATPPRAATAAPLRRVVARGGPEQQPLQPGAALPADAASIQFHYVLLAHQREQAIRYRFQLLGLDAAPGDWQASGEVSYPRLPSGDYTLVVEARDADGTLAEPARFAFRVERPLWRHPLTLLAGAGLLIGLGLAAGRWRTRALKRRAERLAREVEARTAELAAANARLEQATLTDPLTGLHNRRYFAQFAAEEAARARRAGPGALLVVLLDVDHFKRINDQHGHEAGDAVLVEIGARLRHLARGGDLLMRWGGEEFLVLLRDSRPESAPVLLSRLLRGLAEPAIPLPDGSTLPVTVSAGAIGFPDAGDQLADLPAAITAADAALYHAKRSGRDRAVLLKVADDVAGGVVCVR